MTAQEKPRALWPFMVFAGSALIVLAGLGIWQLYRLQWKLDLIKTMTSSLAAKPVSLADVEAGIEHGYDVRWLRVRATGHFRHDLERYIYTLHKGKTGWRVYTPFIDPGKTVIFVDRGFVPDAKRRRTTRPEPPSASTPVTITGVIRTNPFPQTMFTPDNEPAANRWYWVDLMAMFKGLPPKLGFSAGGAAPLSASVVLQLEPGGEKKAGKWPLITPVNVNLVNNHLQYALTWFALALIFLVMTVIFLKRHKSERKA